MRADGRNLSLTFGSVQVACVSTSATLDNEDAAADVVTFADVINGTDKRWFIGISGYPDYAPGTFWSLLWDLPPWSPIPYLFKPYGNDVATDDQPHFAGQAVAERKPPLGGDAGRAWTWEMRLNCTAAPTRIDAALAVT